MLMSDCDRERSDQPKSWTDIEWSEPKPKAADDSSAVQAFIDKLRQALKSLERQPKK